LRTLVTGATGFVGAAVARALLGRGTGVRVLVRAGSDRRNLRGLDVEVVQGDLTAPETLGHAVRGCDVVYHVAADYRLWVRDPRVLYAANVEGTRALLLAAAEAVCAVPPGCGKTCPHHVFASECAARLFHEPLWRRHR
jgi:dihydroflavonol-4-reductase